MRMKAIVKTLHTSVKVRLAENGNCVFETIILNRWSAILKVLGFRDEIAATDLTDFKLKVNLGSYSRYQFEFRITFIMGLLPPPVASCDKIQYHFKLARVCGAIFTIANYHLACPFTFKNNFHSYRWLVGGNSH